MQAPDQFYFQFSNIIFASLMSVGIHGSPDCGCVVLKGQRPAKSDQLFVFWGHWDNN